MAKERWQGGNTSDGAGGGAGASGSPGKSSLTSRLPVQRKSAGAGPLTEPGAAFDHATSGSTSPVPHQAQLESAFGVDLSNVEAHVGTPQARSGLTSLEAEAATQGNKVAFSSPSPSLEVAAHETAHLVQTAQGTAATGALSEPGDRAEREADAAGATVAAGGTPTLSAAPSAGIHRSKVSAAIGGIIGAILGGIGGALVGGVAGAVAGAVGGGIVGAIIGNAIGGPDYTADEEAVAKALATREGRPNDWKQFLEKARSQIGTLGAAEANQDHLDWNNQAPGLTNTEFGRWLLANGPEPNATTGQMNCWEMVMWSAYRGGFTTKPKLAAMYQTFAAGIGVDVNAGVTAFENALRSGTEFVYDRNNPASPKPVKGDIVIFQNLAAHVAIATGNRPGGAIEIMSLWSQNGRHTFRTTVENLLDNEGANGPVRFFSPSW